MKATTSILICILCVAISIQARSIVSNDVLNSNDQYSDVDSNKNVISDLLKRTKRSFINNGKCPMYYKPVPHVPFLLCVPCSQARSMADSWRELADVNWRDSRSRLESVMLRAHE